MMRSDPKRQRPANPTDSTSASSSLANNTGVENNTSLQSSEADYFNNLQLIFGPNNLQPRSTKETLSIISRYEKLLRPQQLLQGNPQDRNQTIFHFLNQLPVDEDLSQLFSKLWELVEKTDYEILNQRAAVNHKSQLDSLAYNFLESAIYRNLEQHIRFFLEQILKKIRVQNGVNLKLLDSLTASLFKFIKPIKIYEDYIVEVALIILDIDNYMTDADQLFMANILLTILNSKNINLISIDKKIRNTRNNNNNAEPILHQIMKKANLNTKFSLQFFIGIEKHIYDSLDQTVNSFGDNTLFAAAHDLKDGAIEVFKVIGSKYGSIGELKQSNHQGNILHKILRNPFPILLMEYLLKELGSEVFYQLLQDCDVHGNTPIASIFMWDYKKSEENTTQSVGKNPSRPSPKSPKQVFEVYRIEAIIRLVKEFKKLYRISLDKHKNTLLLLFTKANSITHISIRENPRMKDFFLSLIRHSDLKHENEHGETFATFAKPKQLLDYVDEAQKSGEPEEIRSFGPTKRRLEDVTEQFKDLNVNSNVTSRNTNQFYQTRINELENRLAEKTRDHQVLQEKLTRLTADHNEAVSQNEHDQRHLKDNYKKLQAEKSVLEKDLMALRETEKEQKSYWESKQKVLIEHEKCPETVQRLLKANTALVEKNEEQQGKIVKLEAELAAVNENNSQLTIGQHVVVTNTPGSKITLGERSDSLAANKNSLVANLGSANSGTANSNNNNNQKQENLAEEAVKKKAKESSERDDDIHEQLPPTFVPRFSLLQLLKFSYTKYPKTNGTERKIIEVKQIFSLQTIIHEKVLEKIEKDQGKWAEAYAFLFLVNYFYTKYGNDGIFELNEYQPKRSLKNGTNTPNTSGLLIEGPNKPNKWVQVIWFNNGEKNSEGNRDIDVRKIDAKNNKQKYYYFEVKGHKKAKKIKNSHSFAKSQIDLILELNSTKSKEDETQSNISEECRVCHVENVGHESALLHIKKTPFTSKEEVYDNAQSFKLKI